MSRVFVITDARGERQVAATALPLRLGGEDVADIVLPGMAADCLLGHIALSDGHAYLQTADAHLPLFHNHVQLEGSAWLKSGDEVRYQDAVMDWRVQGDMTFITAQRRPVADPARPAATAPGLQPPPRRGLPETTAAAPEARGWRPWQWLMLALFSLLLLVAAFVLTATPVTLTITPPPTQQSMRGLPPPLPLGGRLLAIPGQYTVRASRDGYRPLQTEITVNRGELQDFQLTLEELPGQIAITLDPAVAYRVLLDGNTLATSEQGITAIPGGKQRVRIETDRYLPVVAEIEVAGRGRQQALSFELQPAWADVQINTQPPGAMVSIDNEPLGVTPLTTEVLAGEYTLGVALDLYKPVTVQQTFMAGETRVLDTLVLQPAEGELAVNTTPAGATLSVAGTYYGTTPLGVSLPSGEPQRVRLTRPGYQTLDRTVTLQPGQQQTLDVGLSPAYGVLFVTARPADARLSIDGKPAGKATRRVRLTTRAHTLVFSQSGYEQQQVTVTPRAGVSQQLDITLQTHAAAEQARKAAKTPAILKAADGQRLRLIRPTGQFSMGASRREAGRRANESARLVALKRPFYLAEKEVSNAQFQAFMAAHAAGSAEGVALGADSLPVVNVSWEDAARFCNWLSQRDGLPAAYKEVAGKPQVVTPMTTGYRLPTEAEWAYVARKHERAAVVRYSWPGGYPPTGKAGNFADASIADTLASTVPDYNDGFRGPAPVGSFPARSGFYDLSGNVAEWMQDYYAVYPGMAGTLVTDPAGPATGDHHVVRGSSWRQGGISELRLSYRDYSRGPRPDLGFRIARYAE